MELTTTDDYRQLVQSGKALMENLATDLSLRHGKGFSRRKLIRFRQFYLAYPKSATPSHQLSWSHIDEVAILAARVEEHLEQMGAAWK